MTKKRKNNNTTVTIYPIMCIISFLIFIIMVTNSDWSDFAWCSANGWNEGYCFGSAIKFIPTIILSGLSLGGFVFFLIQAIIADNKASKKKREKTKKPNNSDDDYDDGL